MLMEERSIRPGSSRFGHVPVPIVLVLLVLLPIGPVGWFWGRADAKPPPGRGSALAQIARGAGGRLDESHDGRAPTPPVTGRFRERARAADGSYVGKSQPTLEATI